jgi:cysteine desulfurase family protein (TIGR01976 family)
MTRRFDPSMIRDQFPALSKQIDGHPAVFLDGPGGTQVPEKVLNSMCVYLEQNNSNMGGAFATSRSTDETAKSARDAAADLFNARHSEEIVFGQNMTSLTMAMSRAVARTWQEGDEIIVTNLDHDANITPWTLAAEERGVKVKWLDFQPADCMLRIDTLEELVSNRTKLVAVTLASNAVGTKVDVARVCEIAHQVGALVYVDAVHYTPHGLVDVQALDCDFLAASAYKFFGPHQGIMYGKIEHLRRLKSYKVRPAPGEPPGKWETGTQSFEGLAGVRAAVEYLDDIGRHFFDAEHSAGSRRQRLAAAIDAVQQYEMKLSEHFLRRSVNVPGLHIYGITDIENLDKRTPTFAISFEGWRPREVAQRLGDQGIFVWDGHYYAVAVMERLGLLDQGGLVRIGFVHYNTFDEVDRLIAALEKLRGD